MTPASFSASFLKAHPELRLEILKDPESPAFSQVYALLEAYFGPRGEVEDRDTLARFLRAEKLVYGPELEGRYLLVGLWANQDLVAARSAYLDLDHGRKVSMGVLSQVYIRPEWRRSGIGALLRAVPEELARAQGGPGYTSMLLCEMEPLDSQDPDSLNRLLAYGKAGFRALDPKRVPYSQPEFRLGLAHTGLPLLVLLKLLEEEEAERVPVPTVEAIPRLFYTCHRDFLPESQVLPSEEHLWRALLADRDPVPLLPLPRHAQDEERLAPLRRERVLPLYPPSLQG